MIRRVWKFITHLIITVVALTAIVFGGIYVGLVLAGYKPLVVLSGSMRKQFPPGSVIVVKQISGSQVKLGDVIAWVPSWKPETPNSIGPGWNPGDMVVHRMIKKGHLYWHHHRFTYFTSKGDSNQGPDVDTSPKCAKEPLLGGGTYNNCGNAWKNLFVDPNTDKPYQVGLYKGWHVPYVGFPVAYLAGGRMRIGLLVGVALLLFYQLVRWIWKQPTPDDDDDTEDDVAGDEATEEIVVTETVDETAVVDEAAE